MLTLGRSFLAFIVGAALFACAGKSAGPASAGGSANSGSGGTSNSSGGGIGDVTGGSSSDSSDGGASTSIVRQCVPGETQACLGPGRCEGAQVCSNTGTNWGACECGQAGSGGAPGTGGTPSLGGSNSGVSASGGNATAGTPAFGGAGGTLTQVASGGTLTQVASGGTSSSLPVGTGGSLACQEALPSVGCAAVAPSQTGSLSGQYGTAMVSAGGKQYFIQVNEWGSSASQALSYGGDFFFKMTQQAAKVSSFGAPAGYPSVFIGANNGHSTSNSGLPRQVSSLGNVLTSWTWDDHGAIADTTSQFNAAYEVWFSKTASGDVSSPSGGYLMVWYFAQECQPMGQMKDAGHLIDGLPGCWNVWTGTNNGKPIISYQHQGLLKSFGFDLNLFIKDAVKNYPSTINESWYLTNIFTGFEIWSGGSALESTSFCAEVN